MWGPWAAPMWGFWWIVPLIGMLVCVGFMALMIWTVMHRGHGLGCMAAHGRGGQDAVDLQREIGELRREIRELRASR
jgi:hypothetical protein